MDSIRLWQTQLFSKSDPKQRNVDVNNKTADVYRSLINTVCAAESPQTGTKGRDDVLTKPAASILLSDLLTSYGDSIDDITGINNFADGALALTKNSLVKRNESKLWTSSLPTPNSNDFTRDVQKMCKHLLPEKQEFDCSESIWKQISGVNIDMCSSDVTNSDSKSSDLQFLDELHDNISTVPKKHVTGIKDSVTGSPKQLLPSNFDDNYNSQETAVDIAGPSTFSRFLPKHSGIQSSHVECNNISNGTRSRKTGFASPRDNSLHFQQMSDLQSYVEEPTNVTASKFSWFSSRNCQPKPNILNANDKTNTVNRTARDFNVVNQAAVSEHQNQNTNASSSFCTAKDQWIADQQKKKYGKNSNNHPAAFYESRYGKSKSLGTRRGPNSKFTPPIVDKSSEASGEAVMSSKPNVNAAENEKLKNVDPKMVELMMNEILDHGPPVSWDDIAGLEFAKNTIMEIVVWPMLRPDIFSGLRGPPKGLLLFGPPGTGKTLIGKCIASQAKATFFCISASSLTSKWVGEGEKLVRALFMTARCHQPAVIFIDEIDSLLSQRSDSEHESSRRIKTEFLVQLDGASTQSDERLLIVGATNRPQELDEAARRRLVKRLYIPLPVMAARKQIVLKLLSHHRHAITEEELDAIGEKSEGYSGADMANLCKEAALGPIRDLCFSQIEKISPDQVRPIAYKDFVHALKQVRASVSDKELSGYEEWNKRYGSGGF